MTIVKRSMITAVCVALTVVLPMAFHAVPNAGSVILPMHIPVLLCGLICGWPFGLACGLIGPLLSNLFTGMPPMAALPAMLVELAVSLDGRSLDVVRANQKSICGSLYQFTGGDAGRAHRGRYGQGPDLCRRQLFDGCLDHQLLCYFFRASPSRSCCSQHCLCPGEGQADSGTLSERNSSRWLSGLDSSE